MVNESSLLDIINAIAIFQFVFFGIFLILKGNKIASTQFLKVHLLTQVLSFVNYFFWTRNWLFIRPLLPLTMPGAFLWAPTFYFYIKSRLYPGFKPSPKLLVHAIPAIIDSLAVIYLLFFGDNFNEQIEKLGRLTYVVSKVPQLSYYIYTLYLINKYQQNLLNITASSERDKLSWLYLITYGISLTTIISFILYLVPGLNDLGSSYIVFVIFINIFFFKAILQPDQYLGIDEKKLGPVKISDDKSHEHYARIEEIITTQQLYLDPELNLHNIAQAVRLSDRVVSQSIRQNTDMNFSDYINKKRINYAKEVLSKTTKAEKNVLEVLYEAGFNSKSVFNTQFKKHTGLSPTLFRESNRVSADA